MLERVGEGGMGVVYAVYDAELDRRVALKLLKGGATSQLQERLQREARALARLSHPNVVPVFEVGEHEGPLFIVLEYVRGRTLREWVAQERRSPAEILDKYGQAARGLAAAHAAGLVHRDFKPDNALVDAVGRVRVLDFGLARTDDAPEPAAAPRERDASAREGTDTPLTETGSIVGTPAYMAPEQRAGSAVDHRSDQFAFCVALWEALCGERPYAGETVAELSANVLSGDLRAPARPLAPALRRALERGLRTDPAERWPSIDALVAELERGGRSKRWRARTLGLAAVAAAGATAWAVLGPREDACVDGPARLAEVWNEARREDVRAALAGVDVGYAETTASIVDKQLSAHADASQAGYRDACEAAVVHRSQSHAVMEQRLRCLDDRRRSLGALVDVLAQADEAVLQAAVRSVAGLPAIDSCADLDYVAAEVPPPGDPEVAKEVVRIADDLARAKALIDAAKSTDALAIAQRSLEAARRIDHAPSVLLASNRVAEAHNAVAAYEAGITAALEGFEVADAGARPYAADNLLLIGASLHQLGRYAEALAYRKKAGCARQRAVRRAQPGGGGRAGPHRTDAASPRRARRRRSAREDDARDPRGDHERDRRARRRRSRVARVHARGPRQARGGGTQFERALTISVENLGPDHPDVAALHMNIASVLIHQAENEEALRRYEQALAIQLRVWDADHAEVATTRLGMGLALERLGRYEEALRTYEEVRDSWTRSLGPEHPNVAQCLNNMGETLRSLGRHDEALRQHQAALAIRERALGNEHIEVSSSHAAIGNLLSGMGKTGEAIEHYETGLRIELAVLGEEHRSVALTREALGSALVDLGRHEDGLAQLRGSLAIFAKIGPAHPSAAWTHLAIGRAVGQREGCAAALPHYRDAATIWQKALGDEHPNLARPLAAIASCTTAADEVTEARDRLRRLAAGPARHPGHRRAAGPRGGGRRALAHGRAQTSA